MRTLPNLENAHEGASYCGTQTRDESAAFAKIFVE